MENRAGSSRGAHLEEPAQLIHGAILGSISNAWATLSTGTSEDDSCAEEILEIHLERSSLCGVELCDLNVATGRFEGIASLLSVFM